MFVGCRQQRVGRQREVGAQRHLAHLHVVRVGRHAVHAVGRGNRNRVVPARTAEDPVGQVDRLVAAVAEENPALAHPLQRGDPPLQLPLVRIRVAVQPVVVGVFVGVEPRRDLPAGVLVARRGVGFQGPDVRPDQLFKGFHGSFVVCVVKSCGGLIRPPKTWRRRPPDEAVPPRRGRPAPRPRPSSRWSAQAPRDPRASAPGR